MFLPERHLEGDINTGETRHVLQCDEASEGLTPSNVSHSCEIHSDLLAFPLFSRIIRNILCNAKLRCFNRIFRGHFRRRQQGGNIDRKFGQRPAACY